MNRSIHEASPAPRTAPSADVLVRTATGGRLHLPQCPHVGGAEVFVATRVERLAMDTCLWSQHEIDGTGRTYYETLEDAMRAFGTYAGTHSLVRDALRFVEHDSIWLPYSGSYIALGRGNNGVAWAGKTWVHVLGGPTLELPGYVGHHGGGSPRSDRDGGPCTTPGCTYRLPMTGICDFC